MNEKRLQKSFFARNTHNVAKNLLGKLLVRPVDNKKIIGRICEVESYVGEDDLACHAARGRTTRTEVMFGPPGHAYVYMIYGVYFCLNIVTEKKGFPAAVLIRGVTPVQNIFGKTDGPGKVSREFFIDRALNGEDLTASSQLYVADDGLKLDRTSIQTSPRIGVDYAGEYAWLPWRYFTTGLNQAYRIKNEAKKQKS